MPDAVSVDRPRVRCYFCTRDITDAVQVTLGEYEPAFQCVVCEDCATQPYPLAEIARLNQAPRAVQRGARIIDA